MQHEAITQWARHKFNLADDAQVMIEEENRSDGYCDTCYHEWKVWVVREISTGKILKEFEEDFASILREVLDFSVNNKPTVG